MLIHFVLGLYIVSASSTELTLSVCYTALVFGLFLEVQLVMGRSRILCAL